MEQKKSKYSTPLYDLSNFKEVYEPSEDSFLFLDALEKEEIFLKTKLRPSICLEIGCGSGCVITFLAKMLGPRSAYFATDLNKMAIKATQNTAEKNKVIVEVINTNLCSSFLAKKIDLLLFNPPYVPTSEEEHNNITKKEANISAAWSGGEKGVDILNKLLPQLKDLLSQSGVVYIVALEENNIEEISNNVKKYGFKTNIVLERKGGLEHLYILKIF